MFDVVRLCDVSTNWTIAVWNNFEHLLNLSSDAMKSKAREVQDRNKLMEEIKEMV